MNEVIILAGGLGTRLKSKVPDLPKCLANVSGKPFLFYIINNLRFQNINKFIFALGYKSELVLKYLNEDFKNLNYTYVIEEELLGTGGAIKLALKKVKNANILVTNGDTFFNLDINLEFLINKHKKEDSDFTILTKKMIEINRYGVIEIDNNGRILNFKEKGDYNIGLINAGTYLINVKSFKRYTSGKTIFSVEKNYLEFYVNKLNFYGVEGNGYFIDIGIPEDYEKANKDFEAKKLNFNMIDKS